VHFNLLDKTVPCPVLVKTNLLSLQGGAPFQKAFNKAGNCAVIAFG